MEYASKGVAGSGLGLGIAGTALGVLNGGLGNILGGWGNNGNCCNVSENMPVNRYELAQERRIADLESQVALRDANIFTDQKLATTYATLNGQINDLAAEVRANKDAQTAINMNQAVYNGTNTAAIGCIQNQINQLMGLTKLVVPNTSVCPGWGNVTITPATTTAG